MREAMRKPLEGITVVEVATWAFVPSCGGILSDMGATVIKVEPPTGDPLRGLTIWQAAGPAGLDFSWESYNRGKRSITLDLRQEGGRAVLDKLLAKADVFLTNLLPRSRKQMKIDVDTLRAAYPKLIYAIGSGLGQKGPEGENGGFDSITFWSRGGVASSMTPDGAPYPVNQPGPAFGDSLSGSMLAGAIAAAIAQRAMTGHASVVEVSLLNAAMWSMQRMITQSTYDKIARFPRAERQQSPNVLVNTYRTSDDRFVALCMLQSDKYWKPFCEVAGRPDLGADPRFTDAKGRMTHVKECLAEIEALFASKTLAEWRDVLGRQDGQWDVVQHVGELKDDRQVVANNYLQKLDYEGGETVHLVSVPMQFDGAALPARPAPSTGADSDAVLGELGYSEDEIIDLKVAGIVF
jgi:crotonobetainyl-CoA:carnitine CoA-transferase CaiB-like acyl-CoA transferase